MSGKIYYKIKQNTICRKNTYIQETKIHTKDLIYACTVMLCLHKLARSPKHGCVCSEIGF